MRWPYPTVLAHRGGGALAPENTLAAIRTGHRFGFRGIECDAMLAADRIPVLIHDPTLERTTNGRGDVGAASAAELGRIDAGSWFGAPFAGEPVPTLAAAIGLCRELGMWMNIEIKPAPGRERETGTLVAREVAAAFGIAADAGGRRPAPAAEVPLLSSFSWTALAAARREAPRLARGWLCEAPPADWRDRLAELEAVALHCDHRAVTAALAAGVREAGYALFCYTVNDPLRAAQLFAWGVDAICTDRLDRIAPAGV
jgi:glycerophosphoryl diester phosphodiesterase